MPANSKVTARTQFVLVLLGLLLAGCTTGVITHDQTRAGRLIIDFLESLKSEEGIERAYAWTDDHYKEEVSASEFRRKIARLRNLNQGAPIELAGFETLGPVNVFVIYAQSSPPEGNLYFRFVLRGSKSDDYYLLAFTIDDTPFEKQGFYQDYEEEVAIENI